ncbi:CinA family protein [Roseimaritima ulvae]|uniref:Competence-damage inducible protein n=1 Tax=Roseimaritima ulvae TaxID=980254 RepID=A0A5B9QWL8_9BACT|nr:nicotinamide-nucleotide amidohydrolase family protein [Roseimaritima ulvae]QEG42299.1 Putative competence-damage inducible protein [Roseimaritima ulvae]
MAELELQSCARLLAERLADRGRRIVFAESCTAGLVAATLATQPGISQWLCGSAVTYRNDTKARWLSVSPSDLERYSAVSPQVAEQMAAGVLRMTPEADLALSVTGHLGPDAPPSLDGLIYIGCSRREPERSTDAICSDFREIRLAASERVARQHEAAAWVLALAADRLD